MDRAVDTLVRIASRLAYYVVVVLIALFSYDLTCPSEVSAELELKTKRKAYKRAGISQGSLASEGPYESEFQIVEFLSRNDLQLLSDDELDIAHVFHAEAIVEGRKIAWQSPSDFVLAAGGSVLAIEGNAQATAALDVVNNEPLFAILRGVPTNSQWVQNYWGLFAESFSPHSKYTICGFDLNQEQRPLDADVPTRFAAISALPYRHTKLKMQAASVVALQNGAAVVSRKILHDNPSLSMKDVRRELRRIGITHPLWSPSLPGEPSGHMDMCVGFVNGHVVVPAIAPGAERFSEVPEVVSRARLILDKIESMLAATGHPVCRLMMPVPSRVNALGVLPYYTPVNWLAVRGENSEGRSHVSLMIPVPFGVQMDRDLVPFYQGFNERTFRKIGVTGHYVGTILPEFGGGFKCISGRVPRRLLVDKV